MEEVEQKAETRLGASNTRKEYRQITLNSGKPEAGNMFPNNFISTGKYTALTLIPKNLFEQFHRVANIWFLIVSILQILPLNLSPTSSWATIAPLSLVLTVSLIKDAYLDYRRHKSDREINNRPALIWSDSLQSFTAIPWRSLEVGHFLKLTRDEPCPVDILVLSSSGNNGVCYIETANLDGESNLKIKTGLSDTCAVLSGANMEAVMKNVHKLDEALLKTEHPNNRLYTFEGSLKIKGHPKSTSVDATNVILRGSTLKNTQWLLGAVVFTGPETKLMMNSKTPPHKRSNVERRVNKYLAIVFTVLFTASVLSTVVSIFYAYSQASTAQFFDKDATKTAYLNFFTFMILYNGLVPISLYVTIDLVRVLQTRFIQWDEKMYYEPDDRPAIAKTGDLNEDLGQIEFVFSDKTGTLTENQMQLKKCSVKGVKYGSMDPPLASDPPSYLNPHEKFTFRDINLIRTLQEDAGKSGLGDFVELMALCHTVIPEQDDSGHLRFQAASPDEEALAIAAHCFGWTFDNVRAGFCTLLVGGVKKEFKILGVNEFSSTRKRMSVVLQPTTDSHRPPILYCKGADNIVMSLCKTTAEEVEQLNAHLRDFAVDGLRTLLCAKRELTPEEASVYEVNWTNAKNAMSDRSRRLHEVAEEIEVDMDIVGITAIEDKIQEGAPETIHSLLQAGIKVWVLTGDKQETAINIGYGCKLLNPALTVLQLSAATVDEARDRLRTLLQQHVFTNSNPAEHLHNPRTPAGRAPSRVNADKPASPCSNDSSPGIKQFFHTAELEFNGPVDVDNVKISLVVDGPSLNLIMEDAKCIRYFSILTFLCHSVICCRVSPMQKSEMVRLVKRGYSFHPMTLAIGDGANDVSMIQEAHVGVGISGKEGLQAVNSSDYAIARFRFLLPLLFVHGRSNYMRITTVIVYSFYKNFLLILPMFYYTFLNFFSGTALYDSYLIMSYNVALTSLPIVVLGVMDKDLQAEKVIAHPALYTPGIMAKLFNVKVFLKWVAEAIVQSLLIFGLVVAISERFSDSFGKTEDNMLTGTVAFYAVVQTVSFVICVEMKDWTWLFLVVISVSMLLFYPLLFLYDAAGLPAPTMIGVAPRVFSYPAMFLAMVLTPFICLAVHLTIYYMQGLFWPNEAVKLHNKDTRTHPEQEYSQVPNSILHFRPRQFANRIFAVFHAKGLKREVVEDKDDYSMGTLTLEFNNSHLERSFKRFIVERSIKFIRKMIWCFFGFVVIWSIYDITRTDREGTYIGGRVVVCCVVFLVAVFCRTRWFKVHYELCVLTIVGVGIFVKIINDILSESDGSMSVALIPILAFILFNLSTYKVFIMLVLAITMYLLRVSVNYAAKMSGVSLSIIVLNYSFLIVGNFFVSAFVGYTIEKERRTEFVLRKRMESEFQKGQDILGNLLPKFVKDRVKQGVRYIAEEQGIVTIMFCDIYGFDKITATHSPKELTDLLDGFFGVCDGLCEKHGVTKIETVNKTYLICGGLKDSEEHMAPGILARNHAERTISMALAVLKSLELVFLKSGEKFKVKIGINTGPILAGVVGEHKPQFSLIGDTINTASRMCSTLKHPDCIQITTTTYELVKHMDVMFEASQAEAKGKGMLKTFFVTAKPSQAGRKQGIVQVKKAVAIGIVDQQQLPGPTELNDSQMPLIDKKMNKQETYTRSQTLKKTFDDARKVGRDEEEELDLAGPVQWINCAIRETAERKAYRISCAERDFKSMKVGVWMTLSIFSVVQIVFISAFIVTGGTHGSGLIIAFRLFTLIGILTHAVWLRDAYQSFAFPWLLAFLYAFTSFISTATLYTIDKDFIYSIVLEVMYSVLVANHICGLPFSYILCAGCFTILSWLLIELNLYPNMSDSAEPTFFIVIFTAVNMAASFVREAQDRKTHNLQKLAAREIQNTEKLLKQMMPAHVVKNLKNGIAPTDSYDSVTILYADIVGFTAWSSNRKPIEVVTMLSKLFTTFDHLCVKNHVYKVHTIGDCYVILGFADTGDGSDRHYGEECVHMLNMAIDMVKAIKKVNREKKINLNMRIGLHTGTLIAGITGTNIVRYDIYGGDNDIANKMESGGAAGKINVSEDTMRLLEETTPGRFAFAFNKVITHEPTNRSIPSFFVSPTNADELVS